MQHPPSTLAALQATLPTGAVATLVAGPCTHLRPDADTPSDTCGAWGVSIRIDGLPHGRKVFNRFCCPKHGGEALALQDASRDWLLLAPASVGGPAEVHEAGAMQIDSRGTVATVRNLALFEKAQPARVRVGLDPATHAALVRTIGERAAMHAGWRGRSRSLIPEDAEATIAWLRSVLGPAAQITQDPETPKAPPADDGHQWQAYIGTGTFERAVGKRTGRREALILAADAAFWECDRQRRAIYAARGLTFKPGCTPPEPPWGLQIAERWDMRLYEVAPGGARTEVPYCPWCRTPESWDDLYHQCHQCGGS